MNSREAAFLALLHSLKGEGYISDFLEQWYSNENPSLQDYHLAYQIAYGSSQMALALDYLAKQACNKKKIHLKVKERALFHTAIYQLHFLDRMPAYAVVDETIKISKNYFHRIFIGFLNATLRSIVDRRILLPEGDDPTSLSIRFSYPIDYVVELIRCYGQVAALKILERGNQPSKTMARMRKQTLLHEELKRIKIDHFDMIELPNDKIKEFSLSPDFYIQNATPVSLIGSLCSKLGRKPERILDMCAAPGGKILAVHDYFPYAELHANDISTEKIAKLKDNFKKYKVTATISCSEGQHLELNEKFDVIILDVPCSNTGVLNKRPEARWRLTTDHYQQLEILQKELINQAMKLLNSGGEIWYMTCSILPHENEDRVAQACQDHGLKVVHSQRILPNEEGWDGGYACSLKKN